MQIPLREHPAHQQLVVETRDQGIGFLPVPVPLKREDARIALGILREGRGDVRRARGVVYDAELPAGIDLRADGIEPFVARRRDYDLTVAADTERLFAEARPELVFHLAAEVGGIGALAGAVRATLSRRHLETAVRVAGEAVRVDMATDASFQDVFVDRLRLAH